MTHHIARQRSISVPLFLLCVLLITTLARGATERTADADSTWRAAQSPEKPQSTKYDLRYKLKRGDVLRFEVTHRASIRTTIDETTQAAQTKTDSVKVWKVIDVLPAGDIEFINSVERVHMVNQLPDRDPVEYDSDRDETPPPGFEDAASAVGVPLSVVRMTKRGKIVRRQEKIPGRTTEEDAPIALRLPEKPVAIGDTWDDPFELPVLLEDDKSKTIQTRRHHKLADVSNGIATIEVTYQVLSPIDARIESQLVQRLMEGEVRFDMKSGRIIGQQMDIDKRILGFAGPTSSMQFIMRMEEELLKSEPKIARKATNKPARNNKATASRTKPTAKRTTTANKSKSGSTTRSASRSRTQQNGRSYRR